MTKSNQRIFYFIFIGLIVFLFVWFFLDILVYILISAIISLIGRPIMKLLGRIRMMGNIIPKSIQAVLTLGILAICISLLILSFLPGVISQIENLENIDVETISEGLNEPIAQLEHFLTTYKLVDKDVSVEAYFRDSIISVVSDIRFSNIINSLIGFTGDFFIAIFSIIFISFFFLKDEELFNRILFSIIPTGYENRVLKVIDTVKGLLSRYFIGVLIEVFLVGLFISIGLSMLGVESAILIGFLAGIFNVIPYLGPLIGAVLGVSLTILSTLEMDFYGAVVPLILKVLAVITIVQLIDNFIFQPFIYSSSVKAHPLEIFLVILMAGSLVGIVGMIAAIPTYTLLRAVAKEFFNQFKVVQSITRSLES